MGRQIGFHVTVLMTSVLGNYWEAYRRFKRGGSLTGWGVLLFKNRDGPVLYSMFLVLVILFSLFTRSGQRYGLWDLNMDISVSVLGRYNEGFEGLLSITLTTGPSTVASTLILY